MNVGKKIALVMILVWSALLLPSPLPAQNQPLTLKISSGFHFQNDKYRVEKASGFGVSGQMNFRLLDHLYWNFKINYHISGLNQSDMLDEWRCDCWEKTYVDFLPGADVQIVNQTFK
ncbi:MAG TPA: hypothetical protein ENN22_02805 [bacterium]|nr:hypothetical protein [bacterium]